MNCEGKCVLCVTGGAGGGGGVCNLLVKLCERPVTMMEDADNAFFKRLLDLVPAHVLFTAEDKEKIRNIGDFFSPAFYRIENKCGLDLQLYGTGRGMKAWWHQGVCLFVGCLMSQQHAIVFQGRASRGDTVLCKYVGASSDLRIFWQLLYIPIFCIYVQTNQSQGGSERMILTSHSTGAESLQQAIRNYEEELYRMFDFSLWSHRLFCQIITWICCLGCFVYF